MMSVFSFETGTFVWSITASWHDWGSHLDINISTASDKIALNINMNLNRPINRYWCPIDSSLNETFIKTQQQSDAFRRLKPCDYPSPWMFYAAQLFVHSSFKSWMFKYWFCKTLNNEWCNSIFCGCVFIHAQAVVFMTLLRGRENNKYQPEMKYEERILTNRGFKVLGLRSHPRNRSLLLALLVSEIWITRINKAFIVKHHPRHHRRKHQAPRHCQGRKQNKGKKKKGETVSGTDTERICCYLLKQIMHVWYFALINLHLKLQGSAKASFSLLLIHFDLSQGSFDISHQAQPPSLLALSPSNALSQSTINKSQCLDRYTLFVSNFTLLLDF